MDIFDDDYVEPLKDRLRRYIRKVPRFFANIHEQYLRIIDRIQNNGIAEADVWSLDFNLCKWLLPRLDRFLKIDRWGIPSYFSPFDEDAFSRERFDDLIAKGCRSPDGIKDWEEGKAKWNAVLQEIRFALDWKVHYDFGWGKEKRDFLARWNLKDPEEKIEANKNTNYHYRMSDSLIKADEDDDPILKEFGGLDPNMMSDEPDLHVKEPDKYTLIKASDYYCNYDLVHEYYFRAQHGFELLGKHLSSLTD